MFLRATNTFRCLMSGSRETQKCVGFLSISAEPFKRISAEPFKKISAEPFKRISAEPFKKISAEPWKPLSLKILLDEITLETYDRPGSKKKFVKLFIGLCS